MKIKEFKTQLALGTLKEIPGTLNPFQRTYLLHLYLKSVDKTSPTCKRLKYCRGLSIVSCALIMVTLIVVAIYIPQVISPVNYVRAIFLGEWGSLLFSWGMITVWPTYAYFFGGIRGFGDTKHHLPLPLKLPGEEWDEDRITKAASQMVDSIKKASTNINTVESTIKKIESQWKGILEWASQKEKK